MFRQCGFDFFLCSQPPSGLRNVREAGAEGERDTEAQCEQCVTARVILRDCKLNSGSSRGDGNECWSHFLGSVCVHISEAAVYRMGD